MFSLEIVAGTGRRGTACSATFAGDGCLFLPLSKEEAHFMPLVLRVLLRVPPWEPSLPLLAESNF